MSARADGDAGTRAEKPERPRRVGDGIAESKGVEHQAAPLRMTETRPDTQNVLEEALRRENMLAALERVVGNGGAPGVDGMTVEELRDYCRDRWPWVRSALRAEEYRPQPVRRVEIPKPGGGTRMLGIPTVLDRLIQQALLQVLTPIFDPGFSESSFGFRPGRSTHQAVLQARTHVRAGHRWVVDMDLEKFFDQVNHDVLMSRVARTVTDKRALRLIRRYLQAGIMEGGVVSPRAEGTPQGGPLSPLLSNILLDELDRELEQRGHRFVRYADDCNVYVKSKAAGERVLDSLERFLAKRLRLKVNRSKSAVDRPWNRKFLGYSFTTHHRAKLKVAPESVKRLKGKLRAKFRRGRGRNLKAVIADLAPLLRGWAAYFKLSEVKNVFEQLDQWIRRKLRCIQWRQWKRPRTRAKKLLALGLDTTRAWRSAYNGYGPWRSAKASFLNLALPSSKWRSLGLVSLLEVRLRLGNAF